MACTGRGAAGRTVAHRLEAPRCAKWGRSGWQRRPEWERAATEPCGWWGRVEGPQHRWRSADLWGSRRTRTPSGCEVWSRQQSCSSLGLCRCCSEHSQKWASPIEEGRLGADPACCDSSREEGRSQVGTGGWRSACGAGRRLAQRAPGCSRVWGAVHTWTEGRRAWGAAAERGVVVAAVVVAVLEEAAGLPLRRRPAWRKPGRRGSWSC